MTDLACCPGFEGSAMTDRRTLAGLEGSAITGSGARGAKGARRCPWRPAPRPAAAGGLKASPTALPHFAEVGPSAQTGATL